MLKLKYLFENFELARQGLALYEYDEESLEEMMSFFRISSNAIYPFRLKGNVKEICFLRLSPVEEKLPSHVESDVGLILWLKEKGFPAMKPVPMKTGEFSKVIQTKWGDYNVSCFAKVPGNSLEDTKLNPHIVEGYGRILGRFHELMKTYPYGEKHGSHRDLLQEIGSRLEAYGAPEHILQAYQVVCSQVDRLSISLENYGVIHYDFEPDNVFYDETVDAFSVIDFDDAITCWYALDIIRALDALDEGAAEFFLKGYESETKLTAEQRTTFFLMRKIVALQEYATILHVLSEPVDNPPEWMAHIIRVLKQKLIFLGEKLQ